MIATTTPDYNVGTAPMGNMGTGAAFILPDQNPVLNTIEQNYQAKIKTDQEAQKQRAQDYNSFLQNQPTAWDVDVPALNSGQNDLLNLAASIYKRGGDINNPSDPDYYKFNALNKSVKDAHAMSIAQQARYNTAMNDIMANPKKYSPDVYQKLQDWRDIKDPTLRSKQLFPFMTEAEEPYDFFADQRKQVANASKAQTIVDDKPYEKDGILWTGQTTSYPEDFQNNNAQEFRLNPKADQFIRMLYEKTTPEQQAQYTKEAIDQTQKYGRQYSPIDMFTRHVIFNELTGSKHTSKPTPLSKTIINLQNGANGGGSGDPDEDNAAEILKKTRRILNADPAVVQPATEDELRNFYKGLPGGQTFLPGTHIFSSTEMTGEPMGVQKVVDVIPQSVNKDGVITPETKTVTEEPDNIVKTYVDDKGNGIHILQSGKVIQFNKKNAYSATITPHLESYKTDAGYKKGMRNAAVKLGITRNGKENWEMPTGDQIEQPQSQTQQNWQWAHPIK